MKNNIILTGFMATGKTTVGPRLARELKKKYVDTDKEIERTAGMDVARIFAVHGEQYFREEEALLLERLVALENCVIATGGGSVMHTTEMDGLRQNGWVICLTAPVEVIKERAGWRQDRPLLARDGSTERIKKLLAVREPLYRQADLYLDTGGLTVEEVTGQIVDFLRQNGGMEIDNTEG